ncbi:MAG: hypothetical protein R2802_12505 [Flavobacteriaceae bacterium]
MRTTIYYNKIQLKLLGLLFTILLFHWSNAQSNLPMKDTSVIDKQTDCLKEREQIITAYKNKDYNKVQELASNYLKNSPYDYEICYLLAQTEYFLKKWSKAITYFKIALDFGYNVAESKYNIACCYALQGNSELAFKWLNDAINDHPSYYYQWMEDSDLSNLANNQNYLNKLSHYNRDAVTRHSKWLADIEFFNERMRQFHFNLFENITEKDWDDEINKLEDKIGSLKDHEIVVELMKIAAKVGDGHTVVAPPVSGDIIFHRAPFLTHLFDDGLYIINAKNSHSDLLGAKVLKIDDMPINEVANKVQTVISHDNQFGIKWLLPLALNMPELLNALKITQNKIEYKLEVEKDGNIRTLNIVCNDELTSDFLESWLYGFYTEKGWSKMSIKKTPTSQTRLEDPYWFEYLPEDQLVVFHYNQVQTSPEESESEFTHRLTEFVSNNKVKALIVDLRSNEGGDNTIYQPILNGIISNEKINKKRKLFVFIGRRTFSAGMCFATELEKSTNAIFVGEPTGSSPNFVGESGGVFQLPYSEIWINASNLFWQNSYAFDKRKFISPQVFVKDSFRGYYEGVDSCLEVVKQMVQGKGD